MRSAPIVLSFVTIEDFKNNKNNQSIEKRENSDLIFFFCSNRGWLYS